MMFLFYILQLRIKARKVLKFFYLMLSLTYIKLHVVYCRGFTVIARCVCVCVLVRFALYS